MTDYINKISLGGDDEFFSNVIITIDFNLFSRVKCCTNLYLYMIDNVQFCCEMQYKRIASSFDMVNKCIIFTFFVLKEKIIIYLSTFYGSFLEAHVAPLIHLLIRNIIPYS